MTRPAPLVDPPQVEILSLDLDGTRTVFLPRNLLPLALRADACERDPWETAQGAPYPRLDDLPVWP